MPGFRHRLIDLARPRIAGLPNADDAAAGAAAEIFVDAALARAPQHFRVAIAVLDCGLWLWCLPAGGLPPRPEGRRWRWARMYGRLPGPFAGLFRLYGGLAALAFFEHPTVTRHLGLTDTRARQATFRAKVPAGD